MASPLTLLAFLAFFVGASVGSFINVVALRLPLGRSIVRPPSHCPTCATSIRWFDNIPILSWLLLRGRCRHCNTPISFRYPLVELVTAALSLALWTSAAAPFSPALPDSPALLVTALIAPWLLHLTFVATLIALTLIDLDWFLLPNRLTLTLTLLGLLASLAIPTASGVDLRLATWGVLLGGALPWLVAFTYALVTGRTGLGGGDWKLTAAIGAWLGPVGALFALFGSAILALLTTFIFRRDFALHAPPPLPNTSPAPAPHSPPATAPPPTPAPPVALTPPTTPALTPTPAAPVALTPPTTPALTPTSPVALTPPRARSNITATPSPIGRLYVPLGPFLATAAIAWLLHSDLILPLFSG